MKKVIVDIKGGVGNQLFCYAFGYALSKELGAKICIDTSMPDNNNVKDRKLELLNFNVKYDKRISYKYRKSTIYRKLGINRIVKRNAIGWNTRVYHEKKEYEFDSGVFKVTSSTYFDGFWQSYKYFEKYRDEILDMIVPSNGLSSSALKLVEEIDNCQSVSLHVRRGDYVNLGWQLPMTYYDDALSYIKQELGENYRVYVFTDDFEFVKKYFDDNKISENYDIRYTKYDSDNHVINDLYIMSRCKHNIMANSSYSWWGAYLNRNTSKIVVSPVIGMWKREFYLDQWKCIEFE